MKKTVLILWIVAALFLIAAATLFAQGDIAAGVCGVVIAAVLGVIGFRKKAAPPKQEAAAPVSSAPAPAASAGEGKPAVYTQSGFDFLRTKVAGVTFKNGRRSRQTILRAMHFHDAPFDKGDMELTVERGEFEGKPAFGVFVNGEQIGNIPAEHAPFVEENFSRLDGITHIDVYGGGEGRNYGAEITLRFRKQ